MSDSQSPSEGSITALVRVLSEELLHQDPRAVDLSDGALVRLRLFESIDVLEAVGVVLARSREILNG